MAFITAKEAIKSLEENIVHYRAEIFQLYQDWIDANEFKINTDIKKACADRKNYVILRCPKEIFQYVRPFFTNLGYKVETKGEEFGDVIFDISWYDNEEN